MKSHILYFFKELILLICVGNFHIIIIIRQCSKEVLPSEQILVLDPGKVVIRSDHLAPCPPGIGGFSVHLHQMGALGIIASYIVI